MLYINLEDKFCQVGRFSFCWDNPVSLGYYVEGELTHLWRLAPGFRVRKLRVVSDQEIILALMRIPATTQPDSFGVAGYLSDGAEMRGGHLTDTSISEDKEVQT